MNEPHANQSDLAKTPRRPGRGLHWVALAAAAFTWPLLISGGEVTTYKVGMAVPDWPSTFGENMFLYDFWNASVGVFKEHVHRLLGATLGFAAIVLAAWAVRADPRRWMKWAGVGALAAVCVQGAIGGSRVRLNSQALAAFHACSGQAVFALLVAIAVWTGPSWWRSTTRSPDDHGFRPITLATLLLIYAQIILGAWVRHFASPASAAIHAFGALCVLGTSAWLIHRIVRRRREVPFLMPSTWMMTVSVALQVLLGLAAFWMLIPFDGNPGPVSPLQALIRTGHQANGALLLSSAIVLTLRAFGNLDTTLRNPGHADEAVGSRPDLEAVF